MSQKNRLLAHTTPFKTLELRWFSWALLHKTTTESVRPLRIYEKFERSLTGSVVGFMQQRHEILFVKLTDNKTPDHKVYSQFIKDAPKRLSEPMAMVPMIETIVIEVITEEALLKLACTVLKSSLERI